MVQFLLLHGLRLCGGRAEGVAGGGEGVCGLGSGCVGRTLATAVRRLVRRGHGRVQRREVAHHLLVEVLLVGVDGLRVLAQVVEPGELLAAVAGERPLAGVFSGGTTRQPAKKHDKSATHRTCLARCSLRLKTIRQSPYPLHWNVFAGAAR